MKEGKREKCDGKEEERSKSMSVVPNNIRVLATTRTIEHTMKKLGKNS